MSIIYTLKKLVDPIRAREEESDLVSRRNPQLQKESEAPPGFKCRICGYTGLDGAYCPECLAETMELVPAPNSHPE